MILYGVVAGLMLITVTMLHRHEFAGEEKGIHLWKPLSSTLMTGILLIAFFRGECARMEFTLAILAGILLCFGGDMALMFMNRSKKAFRIGLVLFLLGHVAYIAAFTWFSGFHRSDWISGAILAVLGIAVYVYLLPGLGDMKIPVLLYVIIISVMVNRAVSVFSGDYFTATQAWLITGGAVLFYVSDVILALARFRHTWRYGRINLAFYYAGQVLTAMSAGFFCVI